jgi:transposase-like protein
VREDWKMAFLELLRNPELEEDVDFLREGVRAMAQQLVELEVAQHVGADKYERVASRSRERNGYRDRNWILASATSRCTFRMCVMAGISGRFSSQQTGRLRACRP